MKARPATEQQNKPGSWNKTLWNHCNRKKNKNKEKQRKPSQSSAPAAGLREPQQESRTKWQNEESEMEAYCTRSTLKMVWNVSFVFVPSVCCLLVFHSLWNETLRATTPTETASNICGLVCLQTVRSRNVIQEQSFILLQFSYPSCNKRQTKYWFQPNITIHQKSRNVAWNPFYCQAVSRHCFS